MSEFFDPKRGLILVTVEVEGPVANGILRLALDTGASGTMINAGLLATLGYDSSTSPSRVQITTGSGVEYVPRLPVLKLKALGQERRNFPILSHTLPPSAKVDGVLGLDFLRDQELTIDFRSGLLTLK